MGMEIENLTSRENARLVRARKVRDGRESSSIFIEGRRLVDEALRSDLELQECFVVDGFHDAGLLDSVTSRVPLVASVPERLFSSISDTKQPQGIILLARRPQTSAALIEASSCSGGLPIVLFLYEINNPSNLGAVLRTAAAAGVAGLIVSENSADIYAPKSLRASMGAGFGIPVWDYAQAADVLDWAYKNDLAVTTAEASAQFSYAEIDWTRPRLLVFGSEAHGLNGLEIRGDKEAICIPMAANVESLNLAVSAGIILFEARRQVTG